MLCDDPLGLFSTESSDIKESLPPKVDHTVESNANAMTSSVTSMDIGTSCFPLPVFNLCVGQLLVL